MFARLVGESFVRNPRRKMLTAAALVVGMAVATATLTVALEVGDRLAREFRSLGANLLVTPQSDTLPLEIGGVDYRPVDEGAYLHEADLGKLKTIFWRHNILGFTPFLDVPATRSGDRSRLQRRNAGHADRHLVQARCAGARRHEFQNRSEPRRIRGGRSRAAGFTMARTNAVVGAALAAKYPGGIAIGTDDLRDAPQKCCRHRRTVNAPLRSHRNRFHRRRGGQRCARAACRRAETFRPSRAIPRAFRECADQARGRACRKRAAQR